MKNKKTVLTFLCMVLACVCAANSFLGPGILAEIAIGTITATDVVLPMEEPVQPMADVTAQKVSNVLVRVYLKSNAVTFADFQITGTNVVSLHKYKKGNITEEQLYDGFWEHWDDNQQTGFAVLSSDIQPGTHLIDFCFNIPFSQSNPMSTLSFHESSTPQLNNVFEYKTYLMGDVNGDALISAADYNMVMEASVNSLTPPLTDDQKVVADVNENGVVDAKDALPILKYSVATVASLWDNDQVVLPTEPNSKIVPQGWYRIKNAQTGQYIMGGNTEAEKYQANVGIPSDPKAACLKFKITPVKNNGADTGYYSLRCLSFLNDTLYLKLNSNYELTLAYGQGEYLTFSGHWYLLYQTDGSFRMVNRAVPKRALTDFGYTGATTPHCAAGYSDPGSDWILEPVLTISYYYDQAYLERNPDAQSELTARQTEIGQILTTVFGVNPVLNAPGEATTPVFADECSANKNTNCSCSGRTPTSCKDNCREENYSLIHHKNANTMLYQWRDTFDEDDMKLRVLFSGQKPCYVTKNDEHKYMTNTYQLGGLALSYSRIAEVFDYGGTLLNVDYLTPLHEISHCLGAYTGTNLKPDTVHNTVEGKGRCVMSYSCDEVYLLQQKNNGNYRNLFCNNCYTQIKNNLYVY